METVEISKKEYEELKAIQKLLKDDLFVKKLNQLFKLLNDDSNLYLGEDVKGLQLSVPSQLFDEKDDIWDDL